MALNARHIPRDRWGTKEDEIVIQWPPCPAYCKNYKTKDCEMPEAVGGMGCEAFEPQVIKGGDEEVGYYFDLEGQAHDAETGAPIQYEHEIR